jgi:hypothetical protein
MKKELKFPITIKTSITFNDRQELLNFLKSYEQDSHYVYPNHPELCRWDFIQDIAKKVKSKNSKIPFDCNLQILWNTIKTKFKKHIRYFKVIENRIEFNDDKNEDEASFFIYVDKEFNSFKLEFEDSSFAETIVTAEISVIIDKIENTLRVQEYLK